MRRFVVSLDADETLIEGVSDSFKAWLPTAGCPFDVQVFAATHSWQDATGGRSTEELGELYADFLLSEQCPRSSAVSGAREALQRLRPIADLPLLTARSLRTFRKTMSELTSHFGDYVTHGWFGANGTKHEIVRQNTVHVHVDDSYSECARIVEVSSAAYAIAFVRPHCKGQRANGNKRLLVPRAAQQDTVGISPCELATLQRSAWEEAVEEILNIRELLGVKKKPPCAI